MKPGYVGPLLLLTIGFILLFNNLGSLPWEIWGSLWQYWPVILILSGIQILARRSESGIMYVLAVILSILLITGTIFLAWNGYPAPDALEKSLRWSIFNNSHPGDNNFDFADLDNSDFSNSMLNGANMNFASMQNANFSNSSLDGANMNFADLKYSDLSYANLDGANLNFANLDGANMTGARMEGANYGFARTSKSTICPDSRNGPCW
ncbi:MAG: pentapeptide repeat-containing protein [Candidatus Methanoperedens sp.]|nr:pentapeptide repeat-containing protein [Candidatus Methanoperedens sp.]